MKYYPLVCTFMFGIITWSLIAKTHKIDHLESRIEKLEQARVVHIDHIDKLYQLLSGHMDTFGMLQFRVDVLCEMMEEKMKIPLPPVDPKRIAMNP